MLGTCFGSCGHPPLAPRLNELSSPWFAAMAPPGVECRFPCKSGKAIPFPTRIPPRGIDPGNFGPKRLLNTIILTFLFLFGKYLATDTWG